ncbi:hypothetical protein PG996_010066 [Apiospora saccharicola]|uniref:Uncharacterized protein n=1 Tax=Apiospora saccharicola TaxID=335842 RepID=A0ABR1UMJ7_9PEZI
MSGAKGTGTMKDSAEQPASEASVKPSSQLDSSIKDENPPTYGLTLVDRSIAINAKEEIQRNIDGSGDPHIPDAPGSVLHEMGEDPSERLPTEGSTSQRCEDIIPQSTVKLEPNLETAIHSCLSAESESVSNCSFEETSPLPIDSNVRPPALFVQGVSDVHPLGPVLVAVVDGVLGGAAVELQLALLVCGVRVGFACFPRLSTGVSPPSFLRYWSLFTDLVINSQDLAGLRDRHSLRLVGLHDFQGHPLFRHRAANP